MQSNVCFYAGEEFAVGVRLYTPAKALERLGYRMKYSNKVEPTDFQTYDTFVFSRPHLDQAWVDAYTTCMQQGKRIIIDIDEDFHNLPTDHPGFNVLGQGNPSALNVFERLLERADLVTVSSKTLGDRYATFTRQIKYIPTSWDSENQLWHKPAQRHKTFNIGWVEYASEVPNLMIMREELVRFLQNHDDVLFILGGDLKALDLFQGVNEDKFLYLPFVSYEDFPFLLSYFDVMISPLRKSGYNLSKSDTHLMEAGARRMPWIASKIPSYEDWAEGGLFADKGEEWYKALKTLYMDVDMRHSLGEAGHRKAEDHDVRAVISQWQNVLG